MIERSILLSSQNFLEKSTKIKNPHINCYLKGVNNLEELIPIYIKNVDGTSYLVSCTS